MAGGLSDDQSEQSSPIGDGNYVVQPGDCLSQIADQFGFHWKTLWNLPENSKLKQNRKNPNVLFPGDRISVPAIRIKQQDVATDQQHKFVRIGTPARLRLRFTDDGDPIADETYVLDIDGDIRNGKLDTDGKLDVPIPSNAKSAKLTIGNDGPIRINLGAVDPVVTTSGIQGRLNNLGFNPGPIDNTMGPRTRQAILRFQDKNNLQATGKLDDATRTKLLEAHGC